MTVERLTISLDEDLARAFDELIASRGYRNRSEAFRDLLRSHLEYLRQTSSRSDDAVYCVANLSYVFNHHERDLAERLTELQHRNHDLTVATMHAHLDHENCLESVILKGPTMTVKAFADALMAERGVRHGSLNVVSVEFDQGRHAHGYAPRGKPQRHLHLKPKN